MAKKTVVASLPKRDKKRPLAYVDKQGNVRHFRRGQKKGKHAVLAKKVVSKELLKRRRGKWSKNKIMLFVKGKKVMSVRRARPGGRGRVRRRRGRR